MRALGLALLLSAGPAFAGGGADAHQAMVLKDFERALSLAKPLADNGDALGLFVNGVLFENGWGVAKDTEAAKALKDRAVEAARRLAPKGDAQAQYVLAGRLLRNTDNKADVSEGIRLLEAASGQDFAPAMTFLAAILFQGKLVDKDAARAEELMVRAAKAGDPMAQATAGGFRWQQGKRSEAMEWWTKAAAQGYPEAQHDLGTRLLNGDGAPMDRKTAIEWIRKAAQKGLADAQRDLGAILLTGKYGPKDSAAALHWYRLAAEQDHVGAQLNLVEMLSQGSFGVKKDEKEAAKWLTRAAASGDATAQYRLAVAHFFGNLGIQKDPKAGLQWAQKSADQGSAPAKFGLGTILLNGHFEVPKDEARGAELIAEAAEKGFADAQFERGEHFWSGTAGVPEDNQQAAHWYRQAAEQGHAAAQAKLGLIHQKGIDTAEDPVVAAAWYEKAAKQGNGDAQTALGLMHLSGEGVPKDPAKGVSLLKKAAEGGHSVALVELGLLDLERDEKAALARFQRGKEAGNYRADFLVAAFHHHGLGGLKPDLRAAIPLYLEAAENWPEAKYMVGILLAQGVDVGRPAHEAQQWLHDAGERGETRCSFLERLGDISRRKGRNTEAMSRYVAALRHGRGGAYDDPIREKIADLAATAAALPELPEDARHHSNRAQAFIKTGTGEDDFRRAAGELEEALAIAPWWRSGYYNLAIAQEKAGDLDGAMRNLKLYLRISPKATDRDSVKKRIAELEVRKERESQ